MPNAPTDSLETIDAMQLAQVAGGTSSNDQLTAMLTQITSSIKDLASSRNNSGGDSMTMMMMMMMGGMGGGGGGYVAAAPVAGPPVINVDTSVVGGGRGFGGACAPCAPRRGCGSKKGW
jgi:hypothetical protein